MFKTLFPEMKNNVHIKRKKGLKVRYPYDWIDNTEELNYPSSAKSNMQVNIIVEQIIDKILLAI